MSKDLDIPTEYLNLFDTLDLNEIPQRRAATRVIVDFYGKVLSRIGRSYLNFEPADLSQGVGPQWNKAADRIGAVGDTEIPDQFDAVINRLHQTQNSVDHQFQYSPPVDLLEDAREMAPDWANWFRRHSRKYEENVGQQTARETMIRLTQRWLNSAKSDPESYEYEDIQGRLEELNEEIKLIEEYTAPSYSSTDSITQSLVFLMADAANLKQKRDSILRDYYSRIEVEEQEQRQEYENTVPCYVTEPYDEEFGTITVVTDEYGREDSTLSVDPHHPNTSDEVFEKLKELKPNIRYDFVFVYDNLQQRYVADVSRS
jgi:hypothetical protein